MQEGKVRRHRGPPPSTTARRAVRTGTPPPRRRPRDPFLQAALPSRSKRRPFTVPMSPIGGETGRCGSYHSRKGGQKNSASDRASTVDIEPLPCEGRVP